MRLAKDADPRVVLRETLDQLMRTILELEAAQARIRALEAENAALRAGREEG